MAKKAAVVLAGCGVFDGSEIHEAVITLLNLQRRGVEVSFFAPDVAQADVVDHSKGEAEQSSRNVLAESARIARGNIAPLSEFDAKEFDLLVFPGGFGAAKNICSFAFDGANCKVNSDAQNAIEAMLAERKPIGFVCIAPVIAAKVIADGVKITIGNDVSTAEAIRAMGAEHIDCSSTDFVKDEAKNVFSTPAYMLAQSTAELDAGIGKMIEAMLK